MADVSELFSELSISLFGQPMTATDILTAEIKPHFGEHTPVASCSSMWSERYCSPNSVQRRYPN